MGTPPVRHLTAREVSVLKEIGVDVKKRRHYDVAELLRSGWDTRRYLSLQKGRPPNASLRLAPAPG